MPVMEHVTGILHFHRQLKPNQSRGEACALFFHPGEVLSTKRLRTNWKGNPARWINDNS